MFYQWRGAGFKSSLGTDLNNGKQRIKSPCRSRNSAVSATRACRKSSCAAPAARRPRSSPTARSCATSWCRWGRRSGAWCSAIARCRAMSTAAPISARRSGAASTGSTRGFTLDGKRYKVPVNEGDHVHLHGGPDGFSKRVWRLVGATDNSVTLEIASPDGDAGYPGALTARCTYAIDEPRHAQHRADRDHRCADRRQPRPPFVFHAAAGQRRARPSHDGGGGFLHAARPVPDPDRRDPQRDRHRLRLPHACVRSAPSMGRATTSISC